MLTIGRALAIPWLFVLIRNDPARNWWIAALFALTDNLDGLLARAGDRRPKLRSLGFRRSVLGQKWDPAVDKLFVAAMLIAGMLHGAIPWWLGGLSLTQKAAAAAIAFAAQARHIELKVTRIGKYGEFISVVGIGILLATEAIRSTGAYNMVRFAATVLVLTGITMAARASVIYGREAGLLSPSKKR